MAGRDYSISVQLLGDLTSLLLTASLEAGGTSIDETKLFQKFNFSGPGKEICRSFRVASGNC